MKINQTKLDTQPPADLLLYRWASRRVGGCFRLTAATGSGRAMADNPTRCDPDPHARAGGAPPSSGRHTVSQSPAGDDLRGVTERAIEQIQGLLASSEVRAGGRLPPQRRLASMLGISRPTLRLALKALSVMGAVEAAPRRGTFIVAGPRRGSPRATTLNRRADIAELIEARQVIVGGLAALAAERAAPRDLEVMRREIEAMRLAGGDPAAFVRSYASFHEVIAALTENRILSEILGAVTDLLGESPAHTAGRSAAGDRPATVGWCESLYEAIRRGDSQRAGSIMTSAPL